MSSVISNLIHKWTGWQAFIPVYKHESILDNIIFSLAEDMKLVKHYYFPAHKTMLLQNQSSEDCPNSPTAMTGERNRYSYPPVHSGMVNTLLIAPGSIKQAYDEIGGCQASVGAN